MLREANCVSRARLLVTAQKEIEACLNGLTCFVAWDTTGGHLALKVGADICIPVHMLRRAGVQ